MFARHALTRQTTSRRVDIPSEMTDSTKTLIAMLAHVASGIAYFLTAQEVMNMALVSPRTQPLTGMIYFSDAVSSALTHAWTSRGGRRRKGETPSSSSSAFPRAALLLPVFDIFGLTCALESMRALGGPLYQTLSGLLIPFSALLSYVFLKRTFTMAQLSAIGVVIAGLAVKAKEVSDAATRTGASVPTRGVVIAIAATVSYGFRGLTMEYLSKSKTPLSGNAQTMLMGGVGFATFVAYSFATTYRDVDGLVWAYYNKSTRSSSDVLKVHAGNMLARAFMVKMMMAVVSSAGATQLALSNAIRSVGVIVFSHFIFCPEDARQCLSYNGAVSAAMVVTGGLAYALSAPSKPKTAVANTPSITRRSPTFHAQDEAKAKAKTSAASAGSTSVRRRSARRG